MPDDDDEQLDVAAEGAGTGAPAADPSGTRRHWVLTLLGVVLVGFILYVGQPVLMPLTLACLLAFLVTPLCEWLEHRRVPRVVSVVSVVILLAVVITGIGWTLYSGVERIGENWPAYSTRFVEKAKVLGGSGRKKDEDKTGVEKLLEGAADTGAKVAQAVADGADETETPDDAAAEEQPPATQPAVTDTPAPAGTTEDFLQRLDSGFESLAARTQGVDTVATQLVERLQLIMSEFRDELRTQPLRVIELQPEPTSVERARMVLGQVASYAGTAGLIAVFLLFILLQRDDLRDRVIKLAAGRRINLATQALDDASRRISRYLRAQAIVNGTYGVAIGLGLLGISYGVAGEWFPGVMLWATLCAILRFIPYLGPWLAAAFPLFVSLGHFEGNGVALGVIGMFLVVELISNNVMEPMLYGSAVGMSDFAVIVAATVWTFLWGPVGLLVATPLTTCLVVLGKHVPALRPIDTLLGSEPVLSPHSRLYQRLLSMDSDDADDEVEKYRKEHTLTETFDDLILPALALSERDREAGNLTADRVTYIRDWMSDIVEELGEQDDPLPSDSVDISDPTIPAADEKPVSERLAKAGVVILPASDEADHTAAKMLKVLLDRRGYQTTTIDEDALASEKLAAVTGNGAAVVVISAVPPKAAVRARYLVKKLATLVADDGGAVAQTLVGVWDRRSDVQKLRRRVSGKAEGELGRVKVITTMADAVDAVRQSAEIAVAKQEPINGES